MILEQRIINHRLKNSVLNLFEYSHLREMSELLLSTFRFRVDRNSSEYYIQIDKIVC